MTTGAGLTPGPFLVSRHPLFRGPPAAGRQRVFSWVARSRVVKSHLGSPDVVCHCGGTGDRGLFAPQSSCPGSSRRQGVTPAVHLRGPAPLAASPAQPVSESVLAGLIVSIWAWGADTHART